METPFALETGLSSPARYARVESLERLVEYTREKLLVQNVITPEEMRCTQGCYFTKHNF